MRYFTCEGLHVPLMCLVWKRLLSFIESFVLTCLIDWLQRVSPRCFFNSTHQFFYLTIRKLWWRQNCKGGHPRFKWKSIFLCYWCNERCDQSGEMCERQRARERVQSRGNGSEREKEERASRYNHNGGGVCDLKWRSSKWFAYARKQMKKAGKRLNLKGHLAGLNSSKLLYGPTDIEAHIGMVSLCSSSLDLLPPPLDPSPAR